MHDYPNKTLTRAGADLLAKDDSDKNPTVIDKMILSDHEPPQEKDLYDTDLNDFHNPINLEISSYRHQGETFQAEAVFDNSNISNNLNSENSTLKESEDGNELYLNQQYPIMMIGLIGHEGNIGDTNDTLIAVSTVDTDNPTPFEMSQMTTTPFQFQMKMNLTYSNAQNIKATISPFGSITESDLENSLQDYVKSDSASSSFDSLNAATSGLAKSNAYRIYNVEQSETDMQSQISNRINTSDANKAFDEINSHINGDVASLSQSDTNLQSQINNRIHTADEQRDIESLSNSASSQIDDRINTSDANKAFDEINSHINNSISSLNNNFPNYEKASYASGIHNYLQSQINNRINTSDANKAFDNINNQINDRIKTSDANIAFNKINSHINEDATSLSQSTNNLQSQINNRINTADEQRDIESLSNSASNGIQSNAYRAFSTSSDAVNRFNQAETDTHNLANSNSYRIFTTSNDATNRFNQAENDISKKLSFTNLINNPTVNLDNITTPGIYSLFNCSLSHYFKLGGHYPYSVYGALIVPSGTCQILIISGGAYIDNGMYYRTQVLGTKSWNDWLTINNKDKMP